VNARGIIYTSLIRVIATPTNYEGKEVRLIGYVVVGFEHSALYLSRDDAEHSNRESSVWIDEPAKSAKIDPMKQGFACVVGTFHSAGSEGVGHMGLWPGELTNITLLVRAPKATLPP